MLRVKTRIVRHSRYKQRPSTSQDAAAEKHTTADGSADEDYLHCVRGALPASKAGIMERAARQAVKASKHCSSQKTLSSGNAVSTQIAG